MAVTRGVNRANRDKIAFQLCKQKCFSDALELTGAWISWRSLCWKKILGWRSTVQPPPAQSTSIFKIRCSTHVDDWIQVTWMPPRKYTWPIICSWLAHSRNSNLPIENCPFFPCLRAPCSGTKWILAALSEKVWIVLDIFSVVSVCLFWGAYVIQWVPVGSPSDRRSSDAILCVQYHQIACECTKLLCKSSISELPCQAVHRHPGRWGTQTSKVLFGSIILIRADAKGSF